MKRVEEFKIGLHSAPYLADHGFQDMAVLPGSFYIEKALSLEDGTPGQIRNVTFRNPIILSPEDTVVKLRVEDHGDGHVKYAFYEANNDQCAAVLEIERTESPSSGEHGFSIEAFQARAQAVIDSENFYKRLRQNGNQYGPGFQKVSGIWRAGDELLGKISLARHNGEIDCSFLDSVTQLLSPFILENGKTFVLRSIERIDICERNFPSTLWGRATVLSRDSNGGLVGNVRIFDESRKVCLELSGVALTLLEHVHENAATKVAVVANFTAEPLEDLFTFWGDHFNVSFRVEFAPYNQIFQQLLDPASAFRKNRDGINIILVALEEWAGKARVSPGLTLSKERAEQCFAKHKRCVLPNGLEIAHLNQYETAYVYKEIFEDQCYLRHGIHLKDGDTVVDIGANIGLFSLFVMSRCEQAKIYAFEPAPMVYDLLKANCEAYGPNACAFNMGVADKCATATFTFYEKSSVFSGFHSNENEDRAAIQTVVRNILNGEGDDYVQELTADRLRHTTHKCRLMSISDIIRDNQIERINLLKIDAEKSELEILNGIDERDWPKIDQIVMEIHDRTGETVRRIQELLEDKGYRCALEEEKLLEHSGLFNLYATRESRDDTVSHLDRNVQDFCTALRSFMDHSTAPLILCCAPCKAEVNDVEQTLLSEAAKIPNVHTISSASLLQRYPVKDCYDPDTNQAAHIPYTPEGYAAIGTNLIRTIFNLKSNPYKVIALDCDNTLWKGVCGEDGPTGIEVTAPYLALQQFMIDQMKAGMLLCLCSKNNEKDALEVFDRRRDMLLKREHLVAWRLNWNSKSENIKSLAKELNLGLDSFILLDDNPVECADVKINCPGVLTLQLPSNAELFPGFLNHIWAFDHHGGTKEDENRTRMYQQSAERQRFREQTLSLKDFVQGLQLRVEIAEATEQELGRVSQLTYRTNQFNFTTIRRSENEIRQFLKQPGAKCLVVRVSDRFGDYGLVGEVMYATEADRYKVDTYLLSCRVLGRGVEHAVLSWLGQRALKEGKQFVELTYVPTEKNLPALQFLKSIGGESGGSCTFSAERLATLQYNPNGSTEARLDSEMGLGTRRTTLVFDSECSQRIGQDLYDIGQLTRAIEEYRLKKEPLPDAREINSGNTLESALLSIWRKVLGRPRIGLNDNFFDAGGTSLRAVQVIAAIKKELKENLSIVSLFECPTVSLLAEKLQRTPSEPQVETRSASAAERGQRRRYNLGRRASTRASA